MGRRRSRQPPYPRIRRFGRAISSPPKVHPQIRRPNRAKRTKTATRTRACELKRSPLPCAPSAEWAVRPLRHCLVAQIGREWTRTSFVAYGWVLWNQARMEAGEDRAEQPWPPMRNNTGKPSYVGRRRSRQPPYPRIRRIGRLSIDRCKRRAYSTD